MGFYIGSIEPGLGVLDPFDVSYPALSYKKSALDVKISKSADDLIGSWRWRVWLDHRIREGSASTGTEARHTCERLLTEYQQAQMAHP